MTIYARLQPLILRQDSETAHGIALRLLRLGLGPHQSVDDPALKTTVFGLDFKNPLGLAAGFDKDAAALPGLFRMGFGFVEAGTVTPRPQTGNPRPRVFRDPPSGSVINRMGFPGGGLEVFAGNLRRFRAHPDRARGGVLGINIGMNKDSADPAADYAACLSRVAGQGGYAVVNVSSPNTPGLRGLQTKEALHELLKRLESPVPLLLKVSPDLDRAQRADIVDVALAHGIAGLIVSNTTTARPDALPPALRSEAGGLSGGLLRDRALQGLAEFYELGGGRIPLIGAGGISSAEDAYRRILAGASLVQVYTALVYQGPGLVVSILEGLAARLRQDGYAAVADAVGTGAIRQEEVG